MKVTKEQLKQIIKEELKAVAGLQEQEAQKGEEVVQKAVAIKDKPKVQAVFDKLDDSPEVQAALNNPEIQAALRQLQSSINEAEQGAGATVAGTMVGLGAARSLPYLLKGTAAGKAVLAALVPVLGATGATVAAGAGALLLPVAIGYMIDKAISKKSADAKPPLEKPKVKEMQKLIKKLNDYISTPDVNYDTSGTEGVKVSFGSLPGIGIRNTRFFSASEIQQLIAAGEEAQKARTLPSSSIEKKIKELGRNK